MQAKDFASIIISVLALGVSFLSLVLSWNFNNKQLYRAVNDRVFAYTKNYSEIFDERGIKIFSRQGYNEAEIRDKNRVQILVGLLIQTLDAMTDGGDPREERWAEFLRAIPGPILDQNFKAEDYAYTRKVISQIESVRKNLQNARN